MVEHSKMPYPSAFPLGGALPKYSPELNLTYFCPVLSFIRSGPSRVSQFRLLPMDRRPEPHQFEKRFCANRAVINQRHFPPHVG